MSSLPSLACSGMERLPSLQDTLYVIRLNVRGDVAVTAVTNARRDIHPTYIPSPSPYT